jgi:hypothetical protein
MAKLFTILKWVAIILIILSAGKFVFSADTLTTAPVPDAVFTKLISSTSSIGHGEAIFEFTNPDDKTKYDLNDLKFDFIGDSITDYSFYVLNNISYQSPIYKETKTSKTCNGTKTCDTYSTSISGYETKYKSEWKLIKDTLEVSKGSYKIKMIAYWKPELGTKSIDWIPSLNMVSAKYSIDKDTKLTQSKWAWWNSTYTNKRYLNCTNMTSGNPFVIDGNDGFSIGGKTQIVWTTCRGSTTALYFKNYTTYAVANDTTEIPMEVERGNGTSYNPTSLWTGYYGVWHMSDLNDSTVRNNDFTLQEGVASKTNGMIDGGYDFTSDNVKTTSAYGSIGADFTLMQFHHHVSTSSSAYANVMMFNPDTADWGLMLGTDASVIVKRFGGACYKEVTGFDELTDKLIVLTYDGVNSILYQNATVKDSTACTYSDTGGLGYFEIGIGDRSARNWDGVVDEARLSNSSMSATTVKEIYNNYMGIAGYGSLFATNETSVHATGNTTKPVWNETDVYTDTPVTISTNYTHPSGLNATIYFSCLNNDAFLMNTTVTEVLNGTTASLSIGSGNYSAFDILNCSVFADDGSYNSTAIWSDILTIKNTLPVITTPTWDWATNTNPINISTIYTDIDLHTGEVNFSCFKNGVSLLNISKTSLANGTLAEITIGAGNYTIGDWLNCSLIGSDEYNTTATEWSSTLQILNNNPSITTPRLNKTYVMDAEDVGCNATYSDLDSTGWIYFDFLVNGISTYTHNSTGLVTGSTARINVSETNYTTGDFINCSAYAGDTYNITSTKWSNTIEIGSIPDAFGLSEPHNNWTYRSSIIRVNISAPIVSPLDCFYRINYQENATFDCTESWFNIEFPFNNGNATFELFMTNTTGTYSVTRTFEIDNDFASGKGALLIILMVAFIILPFLFIWLGLKLENLHIPIKLFFILLGMACGYVFLHFGKLVSEEFIHISTVYDMFDIITEVYGYVLLAIFSYWMIMILWTVLTNFINTKKFTLGRIGGGK